MMEQTVFFGNGINLPDDSTNWDGILKCLTSKDIPSMINSNTLKYEYILPERETYFSPWTLNNKVFIVGDRFLGHIKNMENDHIKRKLCYKLVSRPPSCLYKELAKINVNHYITTNYELFLNDVFTSSGYVINNINDKDSRLYYYASANRNGEEITLWNIHGDVAIPSSVMLGFGHYCKSVVEIDGALEEHGDDKKSWIDLFLKTDIHIVGFGLYEEEIDIWYLLVHRMREFRHTKVSNNTIYYYLEYDNLEDKMFRDKKALLEAFNVIVVPVKKREKWEDTYNEMFNLIKQSVGSRDLG